MILRRASPETKKGPSLSGVLEAAGLIAMTRVLAAGMGRRKAAMIAVAPNMDPERIVTAGRVGRSNGGPDTRARRSNFHVP